MDAQSRSGHFETFFTPQRGNTDPTLAVGSSVTHTAIDAVSAEATGKWWADAEVNPCNASANLPVNQTVAV
ncbi:MAG: hypothetical protein AAFU71_15970, partial [Cyanobacteria bacterium J06632_22]